jgi:hypothetical protein
MNIERAQIAMRGHVPQMFSGIFVAHRLLYHTSTGHSIDVWRPYKASQARTFHRPYLEHQAICRVLLHLCTRMGRHK